MFKKILIANRGEIACRVMTTKRRMRIKTVVVNPGADARASRLKDAAKTLMVEAGVPVVPSYHDERQDADFLSAVADKIGYSVLIKARACGDGKGMHLAEKSADPSELRAGSPRIDSGVRQGDEISPW